MTTFEETWGMTPDAMNEAMKNPPKSACENCGRGYRFRECSVCGLTLCTTCYETPEHDRYDLEQDK